MYSVCGWLNVDNKVEKKVIFFIFRDVKAYFRGKKAKKQPFDSAQDEESQKALSLIIYSVQGRPDLRYWSGAQIRPQSATD